MTGRVLGLAEPELLGEDESGPPVLVELVPDLSDTILSRVAALPAAGPASPHLGWWRAALALIALAQLAVALPALVLGTDAGEATHIARELGSWDLALGFGFLFAAWRPARAWGMLPLVVPLVACLVLTTAFDVVDMQASLLRESTHLLDLIGLPVLWMLARDRQARPGVLKPA